MKCNVQSNHTLSTHFECLQRLIVQYIHHFRSRFNDTSIQMISFPVTRWITRHFYVIISVLVIRPCSLSITKHRLITNLEMTVGDKLLSRQAKKIIYLYWLNVTCLGWLMRDETAIKYNVKT